MIVKISLGRLAILISILSEKEREKMMETGKQEGYRICTGKVGTMNAEKVISAVLTAAKRENLWDAESFREEHALYDATVEALSGICRGQLVLSEVQRTVGLFFTVVRGQMHHARGEWIAVCLYGTIGAPIRGFEHETIGLGINHI
ncbi:MAG: HutP family protein [Bacillota bacterium]|nr:hut operon transcriptional regulator HutP [Clostridia bacterium]